MFLNKKDILSKKELPTKIIDVPEWGGQVKVKSLTAKARDKFEELLTYKNGSLQASNIRAKLAAVSIVDENDKLIFTENDIEELGELSGAALDRVLKAALEINHFEQDDVNKLAKN